MILCGFLRRRRRVLFYLVVCGCVWAFSMWVVLMFWIVIWLMGIGQLRWWKLCIEYDHFNCKWGKDIFVWGFGGLNVAKFNGEEGSQFIFVIKSKWVFLLLKGFVWNASDAQQVCWWYLDQLIQRCNWSRIYVVFRLN